MSRIPAVLRDKQREPIHVQILGTHAHLCTGMMKDVVETDSTDTYVEKHGQATVRLTHSGTRFKIVRIQKRKKAPIRFVFYVSRRISFVIVFADLSTFFLFSIDERSVHDRQHQRRSVDCQFSPERVKKATMHWSLSF